MTAAPTTDVLGGTISIEDALEAGQQQLAELGVDLDALSSVALANFARIESFQSNAVNHYYGKLGYNEDATAALFGLVKRFLALSAAWSSLGYAVHLSLPERVDNDGWHGFIIQTRDYLACGELLGGFVHHATMPNGQGESVVMTMAAYTRIFGAVAPELWADCPGCILYGWCSSGTD